MTFHDGEHRINNTGWIWMVMKQRGGTKQNHKRGCWTFFNLHFLDQKRSKYLDFALAKLRGLCKYLANVYNSHSHVYGLHRLTFVHKNKAGKSMQWGESSFKKELSVISHKIWKSLLANWICYIAAKTTTSLWNENEKENGKTRKMRSQANST